MSGYRSVIRALRKRDEMGTLERMKWMLIDLQLAGIKWSADRSVEKLQRMDAAQLKCISEIVKLLALVEAGEEMRSYLKYYSDREYKEVVAEVPPGFERKMRLAADRWDKAKAEL